MLNDSLRATQQVANTVTVDAPNLIDRLPATGRVTTALLLAVVLASLQQPMMLGFGLILGMLLLTLAQTAPSVIWLRVRRLLWFSLMLAMVLPWTTPGATFLITLGPLHATAEGLTLAAAVTCKGLAIIACTTALLSSLDIVTLSRALTRIGVPGKFTLILTLTVRYLDLLESEYARMRRAMKMRGFRPGWNLHTLRSYGQLMGMLLVRSFDRAERVHAAMRCRGFSVETSSKCHHASPRPVDQPLPIPTQNACVVAVRSQIAPKQ